MGDETTMDSVDLVLLSSALEQFPYKLNITRADGVMVFANTRFMDGVLEHARRNAIGQYNILQDPDLEAWGIKEHVLRAFAGETVTTRGVKFPNKELVGVRYGKEQAFHSIYQDITSYPVFGADGGLTHVVTYFVPVESALCHTGVMAAKRFIETHAGESPSVGKIAKSAGLSVSRLAELFLSETGFTVHDYCLDVKMRYVCACLIHPEWSIQEAFEKAGIAYNSHYTAVFRAHAGMTPRQYRRAKCHLPTGNKDE